MEQQQTVPTEGAALPVTPADHSPADPTPAAEAATPIRTMGSMKSHGGGESVQEFYSREEAMRLTRAELDRSPALFRAVQRSMLQW